MTPEQFRIHTNELLELPSDQQMEYIHANPDYANAIQETVQALKGRGEWAQFWNDAVTQGIKAALVHER